MIKNISYIIKRIVIGVGIALVLTFLRRGFLLDVQAMQVDGYPIGENVSIIDNMTSSYTKTINGSPWSSIAGSYGYINGTFSITKVDGAATSINVTPKQVYVNSGNTSWVCSIGSTSLGNSTFNLATYSYKCPINMTSSGLNSLVIQFEPIQTNFPSMYRLVIGSLVSFEIHNDENINIDTSGTTNAINNQINNDNSNTRSIINNNDANTEIIVNSQKEINNTLNNDNVSSDTGQSFFDNFQANSHGLSGIITSPLRLINSLSSSSCSPLSIPLPFVNQNVSLPCMSTIYSTHFSTFLSLYQLITTGVIGYWVLVKLFGHVKGMQSPNDDRIEVFDL